MRTSFVIPTRNAGRDIDRCLASLMPYYAQGHIADIIIVDGRSEDDTLAKAAKYPVKIVKDDSRYSGPSWDLGWRAATGDIVVYLDADAYLGDGFLPELTKFFNEETVGIVGCEFTPVTDGGTFSIAEKDWTVYSWQTRFSPQDAVQRFFRNFTLGHGKVPAARGPCWAARRSALAGVNGLSGLPEKMAPDAALVNRVSTAGWQTRWFIGSEVFHLARTRFRSQLKRCLRDGRETASWKKGLGHGPLRQVISLAPELGGPVVGIFAALRQRNPWVVVFSFTRYAVILGVIKELLSPPVKSIK